MLRMGEGERDCLPYQLQVIRACAIARVRMSVIFIEADTDSCAEQAFRKIPTGGCGVGGVIQFQGSSPVHRASFETRFLAEGSGFSAFGKTDSATAVAT